MKISKATAAQLEKIAKRECQVETLESRGLDSLDFPEVGVLGLKAALEAAYELGMNNALKKMNAVN